MALKFVRWSFVGTVVLVILAAPHMVYTCGPWFETAVFTPGNGPFISQPNFAAGKLGIVLPTFRRAYLIVAYRYLNGLKFDDEQKHDAMDVWNRNVGPNPDNQKDDAIGAWRLARGEVSGVPPEPKYEAYAPVSSFDQYQQFLNCPDDAFKTAATLHDRLKKYGKDSEPMRQWIFAQDQVFSNCTSDLHLVPAALDSKDPLLRADREYQIAAAEFYARDLDHAAAAFDAIAKDSASPWSAMASYLAARAFIRKANLTSDNKLDLETMKEAQRRLEKIVSDPKSASVREPAQRLLDYVRFRTEPAKRVAELEELMVKPDPGPNFRQHFWDYVLLVTSGEPAGDLGDWLRTFYADWLGYDQNPTRVNRLEDQKHAISKWHSEHSLPWLIAALELVDANSAEADELLRAAGQVPSTSPAHLTVRYEALRLTINRKQDEAARKELDMLLLQPRDALAAADRNLLNDLRQKLATSLSDFLAHAAEMPAYVGFDEDIARSDEDESKKANPAGEKAYFNAYAARTLNGLPLALQVESAQSADLPPHLRREIARSAWVRAVLTGNASFADKLQQALKELDAPFWKAMEPVRTASTDAEKHFAAVFVVLENPGLQPSIREGLLRSATLGEIDNYRDNWWCGGRQEQSNWSFNRPPEFTVAMFLSDTDKTKSQQERDRLKAVGFAPNYLASEVIGYAKQRPEDARVPQALHLAVRSTRYGCTNPDTTRWSEAAFNLLHQEYPNSEWTAKTRYHY